MIMVSANAGALANAARVRGMSKRARTVRDMSAMAVFLRSTAFEDEGGLSVKRHGGENPSVNKSSRINGAARRRISRPQAFNDYLREVSRVI
jgi:hypothetical protein